MRNIGKVFIRDLKRLAKTPAAWAVVLFLSVLPSLYTWFNVAGFWNPYDNTGNLRVCVVNEDAGADDDALGHLDLGAQLVDQLQDNDQLGWAFMTRDEALDEVSAGTAYAAFIIPEDFSADVATILSDDFRQPTLQYYVNEKTGPVSPKITDTGASTLDTSINDAFFAAVTSTVAEMLDERIGASELAVAAAKAQASARVDEVTAGIDDARATIADLQGAAADARGKAEAAKGTLATARSQAAVLSAALGESARLVADANAGLANTSASMGAALDDASGSIARASASTRVAVSQTAAAIEAAKGALGTGQDVGAPDNEEVVALLRQMLDLIPEDQTEARDQVQAAIDALESGSASTSPWVPDDMAALVRALDDAAAAAGVSTDGLDQATARALEAADEYRATVAARTIPALSSSLAQVSTLSSGLSGTVANQMLLIDQSVAVLDQLQSTLDLTSDALGQMSGVLAALQGDLQAMRDDLQALGSSNALSALFGEDGIDPDNVAEFMMSPTQVQTVELYPLNAYGSAMAPLFINLTLWIGVFMLMVIIRLEVDDEEVENLTINERFIARGLFLALIAAVQAVICCVGCMAIGVQTASAPLFILTAVIASLAYLSIQYTLSTAFQHVGKAICVILVFVQIPGATGLYPIEMTPQFFRTIYPLFPFTYGVNAMRETISGFYEGAWGGYIAMLGVFWLVFLLIGVLARPYLTNLNRLFAREIAESDMINGESVQLPARRYRMSQIIRAFSDREEYREAIDVRVGRFMDLYPKLKSRALVVAVAFPVVATGAFAALSVDKVIVLNTWLIWFVIVIVFYVGVEYLRDYLGHLVSLEEMSADEARTLLAGRERYTDVRPLAGRMRRGGGSRAANASEDAGDGRPGPEPGPAGDHAAVPGGDGRLAGYRCATNRAAEEAGEARDE